MGVSDADKYEDAFKEATKARSAALAVTTNSLAIANRKRSDRPGGLGSNDIHFLNADMAR
jgi:hypothetical protein